MTQEEQLLLVDLCARLPYGVKGKVWSCNNESSAITETIKISVLGAFIYNSTLTIRPYLRPMSTMTEEERKELSIILNYEFYVDDDFALVAEDDRHRIRLELCEDYVDWLNEHHFDYRGLIEKGLALEAPEGMYKTE